LNADLQQHLWEFFHSYLRRQKAVSPNTIRSYRDTFRLLITYLRLRRPGRTLSVKDMDARTILAFLEHLEDPDGGRDNSPQTRNQRLVAIQSFFRYISIHHAGLDAHARRVRAIPMKRFPKKPPQSLNQRELEALLEQPATTTSDGIRDLAVLLFLYNTGARAQEAADARIGWFDFGSRTVNIIGKGNKERLTPLWPPTIRLLQLYKDHHRRKPAVASDHLFINQRAAPFTRFGIRSIVKKYVRLAAVRCPSLAAKRLSTHSMRHTTAVHLLESRLGPNEIKHWLGHASLRSTERYLYADLEHKRRILDRFGPPQYVASVLEPKPEDPPEKILEWLNDL
jgi:site-specific recombinase XerD